MAAFHDFMRIAVSNRPVEQFGVVLLDTKQRVLRTAILSIGTLDASVVHPREVFRHAVGANASAIVLAHNHPSGDSRPSKSDCRATSRLAATTPLTCCEYGGTTLPTLR